MQSYQLSIGRICISGNEPATLCRFVKLGTPSRIISNNLTSRGLLPVKICAPSYISLHTALSFYGIIPEAVVEISSVTTQKTCRYENAFGQFSYQTIRPRLFWGFEPKTMRDGKQYMMATPEKAIIDLLYLYPQYSSLDAMRELRFDEDWMHDELNKERLLEYTERINSPVINKRLKFLFKAYEIPDSATLSTSFSTPAKVKQY